MANTGYKHWRTLEEYDLDTGIATGKTKPNVETDANYVPPTYDTSACPLPPPPLGWRSINEYCVQHNGQNTGYLSYSTLEQYNLNTGEATGVTKANTAGDPDYMAPVYNPSICGLPDNEPPVLTTPVTVSVSYDNFMVYWKFSDNVQVTSQTIYVRPLGASQYISKQLTANATADYVGGLLGGTTYEVYIRACDAMGNCKSTSVLRVTTSVRLYQITLTRGFVSIYPCRGTSGIYYMDTNNIGNSTMLYSTNDGSTTAPPAFYSDGWYWRYWTGSNWSGPEQACV